MHTTPQFILLRVNYGLLEPWYVSFVYGSLTPYLRRKLWLELPHDNLIQGFPWISVGDFNAIASGENSSSNHNRQCSHFVEWIFQEGLVDLGFSGTRYTWMKGVNENTFRGACMDRALANVTWCNRFPEARVSYLPKSHSNHVPLLITLDPANFWSP